MGIEYISNKKIRSVFKKKPIKSGYYNDHINHPDGGGICDYCGAEVEGGEGYEADFDSTWDEARCQLYMALVDDPNAHYYDAPRDESDFAYWLGGDWTEDDVHDVLMEITGNAFEGGSYMCPDCHTKRIKEAAEKWVEENW